MYLVMMAMQPENKVTMIKLLYVSHLIILLLKRSCIIIILCIEHNMGPVKIKEILCPYKYTPDALNNINNIFSYYYSWTTTVLIDT